MGIVLRDSLIYRVAKATGMTENPRVDTLAELLRTASIQLGPAVASTIQFEAQSGKAVTAMVALGRNSSSGVVILHVDVIARRLRCESSVVATVGTM